ncbi:MAG: hypothetical protein OXN18_15260 [Gemmatimonadota bacterium]|nr:hypothetical protein [Gemmatimonadota bacterium]
MAHLIGLLRSRGGLRAPMGIAIGLSLLSFTAVEGSHTHAESDLSAVCSICKIGHEGVPTPAVDASAIVEADVVGTPALPGSRLISATVHLSPHRSRAPPFRISL